MPSSKKTSIYFLFLLLIFQSVAYAQTEYRIFKKENFYGVINSKNKLLIEPKFQNIQTADNIIFAVQNEKGLWGFYNSEAKISDCQFDNFRFTTVSQIIVQKSSRWGAINYNGETTIDFRYRYLNHLIGNTFKAGLFNQWDVRDFSNKILNTFEFDSITYLGENVYKFCLAGNYGLVDNNSKIITTDYQNIFESTLTTKLPKKEFKKALPIIAKGDFKIPQEERFDTVYHFCEGFAKFESGNKFGFVDSLGNIRLVPQYNDARHFSEGMVAVVLIGKWGFMDKNEKLCVQPHYNEVCDYKNGIALVRKDSTFNFINKNGTLLYGDYFNAIIPTYSGNYILTRKDKVGLADPFGHELVSIKYEEIVELGNTFILAKEHNLWGVINKEGNIVVPFNYSVIQFDPEHNHIITMEPGGEITLTK